jgi:hypothetical protein
MLRSGDIVEIKKPEEILQTLDGDGSLEGLPFMPEMVEYSGRRFRVGKRVVKACVSELSSTNMRRFRGDDVLLLDGLRCSGSEHDGCQKNCAIFWREAWLRKVEDDGEPAKRPLDGAGLLRARLRTTIGTDKYFCQASELLRPTEPLSRWGRIGLCLADVRAGNCTALEMASRIAIWLFWKVRKKLFGAYARGNKKATPAQSLDLRPGEYVDVKPMPQIVDTLNASARNRGLFFSPDMRLLSGTKQRVARKVEKIIMDGTGEMRDLRNTVYLEGAMCGCAHVAFGGCSRCEFSYWREIWLTRSDIGGSASVSEPVSERVPVRLT